MRLIDEDQRIKVQNEVWENCLLYSIPCHAIMRRK